MMQSCFPKTAGKISKSHPHPSGHLSYSLSLAASRASLLVICTAALGCPCITGVPALYMPPSITPREAKDLASWLPERIPNKAQLALRKSALFFQGSQSSP